MVLLWDLNDISRAWCCHVSLNGKRRVLPWEFHGAFHDAPMTLTWGVDGLEHHGASMMLPKDYHGKSIMLPWKPMVPFMMLP